MEYRKTGKTGTAAGLIGPECSAPRGPAPELSPFARPMTARQCMHYALTRPAVVSVPAGRENREELLEAPGCLELSAEERDHSPARGNRRGSFRGNRMYRENCEKRRPFGVPAVENMKKAARIFGR